MKFIKQYPKLSITNLDQLVDTNHEIKMKRHGHLLPQTIRCLIVGPSNCGKTNLLLNLIFSPQGLFFDNVYVFSKSLNQNKYKFLEHVLANLDEIGYHPFSDNDEIPHPSKVKPHSIMIFDDIACGKQNNIKEYFSMGRHNNVDTFYICQTYSFIPKQLVRDNTNLIIIFKQDDRNLNHIYQDHVNPDMSFNQFKQFCSKAWSAIKNGFAVIIDKDSDLNRGRYRSGFNTFVKL